MPAEQPALRSVTNDSKVSPDYIEAPTKLLVESRPEALSQEERVACHAIFKSLEERR